MIKRYAGLFCGAVIAFHTLLSSAYAQEPFIPFAIEVEVKPFSDFEPSKPEKRIFDRLAFKTGAVFLGDKRHFGGLSGMQIIDGGQRLIAISDSGYWLSAKILRDENGQIIDLEETQMIELYSGAGPRGAKDKYFRDAEALAISGRRLFVSFEASNTISEYGVSQTGMTLEPRVLPLPETLQRVPENKGMEALAFAPDGSALAGHLLTILERGGRRHGPTFGWILNPDGPSDKAGQFTLLRDNLFDVTEAGFLKNGDLLVLERRFTLATGVGMRIKHIKADAIKKDAVLSGDVIFEAGLAHRIDNMEAMSIYENDAGQVVLAFLSDDNHSVLQRTIFLEFTIDAAVN